ncbi:UNVERIFIED_ORG: P-type conjugative transfer protein TrbL [Rhizobium esperanzae]
MLIPFAFFNKTAFLAERVLGNIVASGVKIFVLAAIVGIGSGLFSELTAGFSEQPTISEVLSLVLGALALIGLSIFGPGIATGLVSGAPQPGAGAAVGSGLPAAGIAAAGYVGARAGVGADAGAIGGQCGEGRLPPVVPANRLWAGQRLAGSAGRAAAGLAGMAKAGAGFS